MADTRIMLLIPPHEYDSTDVSDFAKRQGLEKTLCPHPNTFVDHCVYTVVLIALSFFFLFVAGNVACSLQFIVFFLNIHKIIVFYPYWSSSSVRSTRISLSSGSLQIFCSVKVYSCSRFARVSSFPLRILVDERRFSNLHNELICERVAHGVDQTAQRSRVLFTACDRFIDGQDWGNLGVDPRRTWGRWSVGPHGPRTDRFAALSTAFNARSLICTAHNWIFNMEIFWRSVSSSRFLSRSFSTSIVDADEAREKFDAPRGCDWW